MPGRRNFARERAQHDANAPARQALLYATLRAHLPDYDRALIGQHAILAYLHDFGVRRRNGRHLKWRIVNYWRTNHNCPILRGNQHTRCKTPSVSSTHAMLSWLLTRIGNDDLYRIVSSIEDLAA